MIMFLVNNISVSGTSEGERKVVVFRILVKKEKIIEKC